MTKYTMTVHEGLAELKVLGKRIEKELSTNAYIAINKHANTKIDGVPIDSYCEDLKSSMRKVSDLIARREAIKRAITISNAKTLVTLRKPDGSSITMSVAELIEYKSVGITYKEYLRNVLSQQFTRAVSELRIRNDALTSKADEYAVSAFGGKDSISADVIEKRRASYIEDNTVDLIDPNNLEKAIADLNDELDFFNTRVDAALSTSNATTVIEFEY